MPDLGEDALDFFGVVLGVEERGSDPRLPHFGADGLPVSRVIAQAYGDVFVLLRVKGRELELRIK